MRTAQRVIIVVLLIVIAFSLFLLWSLMSGTWVPGAPYAESDPEPLVSNPSYPPQFQAHEETMSDQDQASVSRLKSGIEKVLSADPVVQREGVELVKALITDPAVSPEVRGWAVTDLFSIVCGSGCEEATFDFLVSDPPFSNHKVAGDIARSLVSLYQWAVELSPLQGAYAQLMRWHGDQLLSNRTLSAAEVEVHARAIAEHSTRGAELLEATQPSSASLVSYHSMRGYAYGALAATDLETFGGEVDAAYDRAFSYGAESDGNDRYVQDALALARFQYAALLHQLYGAMRHADIEAELSALAMLIDADESPADSPLITLVRREFKSPGFQEGFLGQSAYTLADQYPVFSEVLAREGLAR